MFNDGSRSTWDPDRRLGDRATVGELPGAVTARRCVRYSCAAVTVALRDGVTEEFVE